MVASTEVVLRFVTRGSRSVATTVTMYVSLSSRSISAFVEMTPVEELRENLKRCRQRNRDRERRRAGGGRERETCIYIGREICHVEYM